MKNVNIHETNGCSVTVGLPELASRLARLYPTLPRAAKPHASNLIQQIRNIHTPADAERLRPYMAASMRGLEQR